MGRTGGEKRDKEKENQDFAFGSVRVLSLYPTLRKKKCMVVVAWGYYTSVVIRHSSLGVRRGKKKGGETEQRD